MSSKVESRFEIDWSMDGLPCAGIYAPHRKAGRRGLITVGVLCAQRIASIGRDDPEQLMVVVAGRRAEFLNVLSRRKLVSWEFGERCLVDVKVPWEALRAVRVERSGFGRGDPAGMAWFRVTMMLEAPEKTIDAGEVLLDEGDAPRIEAELMRLFITERARLMARPNA